MLRINLNLTYKDIDNNIQTNLIFIYLIFLNLFTLTKLKSIKQRGITENVLKKTKTKNKQNKKRKQKAQTNYYFKFNII